MWKLQARAPGLAQASSVEPELSVELVADESSFLGLEPAWDRIAEESNIDHPFLTFAWVRTWWECFGTGRDLHILVVRADDEVIGIAPLMLTEKRMYGVKLRCLEFLANVHTPRCDFLIARRPRQVYRAVWTHLMADQDLWD